MADREKIIKALTECIFLHENPEDGAGCLECPYRPDEKGTCPTMIPFLKDVLELLKDDETQLIYRDEIIKAHEDEIERLNKPMKEQETLVRCKNCKYWRKNAEFCVRWPYGLPTPPDWYCAGWEIKRR